MKKNKYILFLILAIICLLSSLIYIKYEGFNTNLDHLRVYHHPGNKIHLGETADGGYVIADLDITYDCYISAGISDEESFSRDFLNRYKIPKIHNYAFDGTIEDYPYNYTTEIQFFKKNIDVSNTESTTNLKDIINMYKNIFIKMDIEGWEIPWINSLADNELQRIAQLVLEVHYINDSTWQPYEDKLALFNKLNKTHYLIHVHGNNHGDATNINGNNIPDTIEVTYVRKDLYDKHLDFNKQNLPIEGIDYSNSGKDDFNLSFYPFKH